MPEVALESGATNRWIIPRDVSRVLARPDCMVRRFEARGKGSYSRDATVSGEVQEGGSPHWTISATGSSARPPEPPAYIP